MATVILLFLVSWLIPNGPDYNHRLFTREIQSVFNIGIGELEEIPDVMSEFGQSCNGKYFKVDNGNKGFTYVGRVNTCRSGGCSDDKSSTDNFSEFFDYFILLDSEARIISVRVYNYQATHGHGITSRGWLRQFIGYQGEKSLEPGKNVDAISGATISAKAISADIQFRTQNLRKYVLINGN